MKRMPALVLTLTFTLTLSTACSAPESEAGAPLTAEPAATIEWGLVIHGGAGTITPDDMTPELEAEYRAKLTEAMEAGHAVLADSGSSIDAVVAAITILEDSPLFNAGTGAVFTADGTHSLDASIMDGATLQAGAVAGVTTVKNPIILARLVMEQSRHVFLAGAGAEEFGRLHAVEMVDPTYFDTDRRWRQLLEAQEAETEQAGETDEADDAQGAATETAAPSSRITGRPNDRKLGTVGVVALDRMGHVAAGTSTGGMTNKRWGRIGDSPVVGAGTYAGEGCGVSGTGWGEYFIRNVVAYDICARVKYEGVTLAEAARAVIMERLESQEPETGGIIALDEAGHVVMTFNTPGMYRGYIGPDGEAVTAIYQ